MKKAPKKFVFHNKWWLKWQFLFCVFGVLVGLFGLKIGFFSTLIYMIVVYGGSHKNIKSCKNPFEVLEPEDNDVYTFDGRNIRTGEYNLMHDSRYLDL